MQYLMTINIDESLLAELPAKQYDDLMRGCLSHADELRGEGKLLASQQLEAPATAKTLRVRNGKTQIVDGPFAETKELLAGFNLIVADNIDEAMQIAQQFPWARYGSVEVRPVHDMDVERRRVGA